MENTIKKIRQLGLNGDSLTDFISLLEKIESPKGHLLIKAGRIERVVYFIEKGIARAYCDQEDREVTFWFGAESDILLSYNSFFLGKPGYENVELLEDSALYKISNDVLQNLYNTDLQIANWGRKLVESELIKTEERFISRQFKTATERYEDFINSYPAVLQRVQLGYIASYLGISQVTLSRIRAEFR
ncbi:Crp/Fnr family transcriptional regulator [Dyadobacter frigoris]|uniref:Crp/Fnr family transcriptional regulator n=1 Tax=Dyadobacter frigoris TaxID=2576211 RepID=A0A4U6DC62_9BACT|nr:Crp/Fnr family transcriptional regulator [Dyadobacter frigoris]TKT93957.1 Crp/Fnr family transcriptional regulator [Dyadobacter frigoris]GLU50825.1 cyclic nucleotide-binding protein [Dyadobacter frigoris]